jgi:hypothetical protein
VDIETGRLANTYTVIHSNPGIPFVGFLSINDDFSNAGMTVRVSVDSNSGMSLGLFNQDPANGTLSISAPGGTYSPSIGTIPDGSQNILFANGLTSAVQYSGFDGVTLS